MFLDVARICEADKPKVIFCENVKGLKIHDRGRTFEIIKKTFEDLEELSKNCKFKNCTHQHEPDCYIFELVEKNKIPYERYQAYIT